MANTSVSSFILKLSSIPISISILIILIEILQKNLVISQLEFSEPTILFLVSMIELSIQFFIFSIFFGYFEEDYSKTSSSKRFYYRLILPVGLALFIISIPYSFLLVLSRISTGFFEFQNLVLWFVITLSGFQLLIPSILTYLSEFKQTKKLFLTLNGFFMIIGILLGVYLFILKVLNQDQIISLGSSIFVVILIIIGFQGFSLPLIFKDNSKFNIDGEQ